MNFRVFDSTDELVKGLASTIIQKAESSQRTVVSLSGGTTPEVLYRYLGSGEARERLASRAVLWVTGDERCVPPDDKMSNSRMINQSLFANGISPKHSFLRFKTELDDPVSIATTFEADWKAAGIDAIDISLLGVGDDGHTASLFPGTPVLSVYDRIAKEVWVEKMQSWRVTLTFPIIRASRMKVVMANGAKKKAILTRLRQGESFPVVEATGGDGEAWWFVDRDAYPGE